MNGTVIMNMSMLS